MDWWIWVLLGLGLGATELLTPGGFYLLFLGVSAMIVGFLELVGLVSTAWVQWLLFSVFAIGAFWLFRRPLRERLQDAESGPPVNDLVGEIAVAVDDIPPDKTGRIELRGTTWAGHNHGAVTITRGHRCRIERVEGVTLWVRSEEHKGG